MRVFTADSAEKIIAFEKAAVIPRNADKKFGFAKKDFIQDSWLHGAVSNPRI
jgi:hypothetical protein